MQQRLEQFHRRLTAQGVPRKTAARIAGELRDHYNCVREELLSEGRPDEQAARQAEERIGDLDHLSTLVLADDRCICLTRRHPRTAFLAGPVAAAAVALGVYSILALTVAAVATSTFGLRLSDPAFHSLSTFLYLPTEWILPPLVAAGFCVAAGASGCSLRWPFFSCLVLAACGAVYFVGFRLPLETFDGTLDVGMGAAARVPRVLLPLITFGVFSAIRRFGSPGVICDARGTQL